MYVDATQRQIFGLIDQTVLLFTIIPSFSLDFVQKEKLQEFFLFLTKYNKNSR